MRLRYDALHNLVGDSAEEASLFRAMVDACRELIYSPEPAYRPSSSTIHPTALLVPKVLNITLSKQPPNDPLKMERTLGSTMTLAIAKSILEKPPPVGHAAHTLPWYELLRQFFTSPDIFPHFRTPDSERRTWNKESFVQEVNTLLKISLERNVIEAFLVYCSHTRDLFRLTEFRREIEPISSGWELCEENSILGLYRKVPNPPLVRPRGIDRLEDVLRENWRTLHEHADRSIDEDGLRRFLNRALGERRISRERMRECVLYWSKVGEFYTLLEP